MPLPGDSSLDALLLPPRAGQELPKKVVQNRDSWRWTRPGCERGCTKSLAETFMQPADDFPIATTALIARGGSDPETCPPAGPGNPHGHSPNTLLTALTYQAGD